MYKCPECNETFESLRYREEGSQYFSSWGDYDGNDFNEDDREYGDDAGGDIYYFCPECEYESSNNSEFETEEMRDTRPAYLRNSGTKEYQNYHKILKNSIL